MAVLCLLIFGILWFVMPFRVHRDVQPTGPPK
jgi:hypothetical protein